MRHYHRSLPALLCAGLLAAAGCKDNPSDPPSNPPGNGGDTIQTASKVDANGVPVITGWNIPKAREHWYYLMREDSSLDPGPAGAGRNWDFSALRPTGSYLVTHYAPGGTTMGAMFPGSTLAEGDDHSSLTAYYRQDPEYFFCLGDYQGSSGFLMRYSSPDTVYRLPFGFGSRTVSHAYGEFASAFTNIHRSVPQTTSADAWGTLTTPAGRFEKTLRVRVVGATIDARFTSDGQYLTTDTIPTDLYTWYAPGRRFPVFQITRVGGSFDWSVAMWDTTAPAGVTRPAGGGFGRVAPSALATSAPPATGLRRTGVIPMPLVGRVAILPTDAR